MCHNILYSNILKLKGKFLYLLFHCTLLYEMPHHGTKDSSEVKEHCCHGKHFDQKELDRKVTLAHSYEALPSYM